MQVPVYEIHDGVGYNSWVKTTEGNLHYTPSGVVGVHERTTLRRPRGRDYRRDVPVNHARMTDAQVIEVLNKCKDASGAYLVSSAHKIAMERGL